MRQIITDNNIRQQALEKENELYKQQLQQTTVTPQSLITVVYSALKGIGELKSKATTGNLKDMLSKIAKDNFPEQEFRESFASPPKVADNTLSPLATPKPLKATRRKDGC